MRGVRGQATIDYLAVVLVIALVAGAMAALLTTTDLGERVMAAFARALCVVTGGPCDEIASPCVTSSFEHTHDTHVNALVFRLGHREVELRERCADGSETVTLVGAGEAGLDFGTGVGVQVRWGGVGWAIGSELRAAVLAEHASGRTWTVLDAAAATRLVDQVLLADRSRHPRPGIPGAPGIAPLPAAVPEPPPPDATFSERGASAGISWQAGSSAHGAMAQAYGQRVLRDGQRTLYVRSAQSGGGALVLGRRLSAVGAAGAEERYGITFDRERRPVDFEVLSALDVSASAGSSSQLARSLGGALSGARHVETEEHLDLTVPENAELVEGFLRAF